MVIVQRTNLRFSFCWCNEVMCSMKLYYVFLCIYTVLVFHIEDENKYSRLGMAWLSTTAEIEVH